MAYNGHLSLKTMGEAFMARIKNHGPSCPMELLRKTTAITCHCRGPCGYMKSNNKEDGDQIVMFLFMNAAHLLCSGSPYNALCSLM